MKDGISFTSKTFVLYLFERSPKWFGLCLNMRLSEYDGFGY